MVDIQILRPSPLRVQVCFNLCLIHLVFTKLLSFENKLDGNQIILQNIGALKFHFCILSDVLDLSRF